MWEAILDPVVDTVLLTPRSLEVEEAAIAFPCCEQWI